MLRQISNFYKLRKKLISGTIYRNDISFIRINLSNFFLSFRMWLSIVRSLASHTPAPNLELEVSPYFKSILRNGFLTDNGHGIYITFGQAFGYPKKDGVLVNIHGAGAIGY